MAHIFFEKLEYRRSTQALIGFDALPIHILYGVGISDGTPPSSTGVPPAQSIRPLYGIGSLPPASYDRTPLQPIRVLYGVGVSDQMPYPSSGAVPPQWIRVLYGVGVSSQMPSVGYAPWDGTYNAFGWMNPVQSYVPSPQGYSLFGWNTGQMPSYETTGFAGSFGMRAYQFGAYGTWLYPQTMGGFLTK